MAEVCFCGAARWFGACPLWSEADILTKSDRFPHCPQKRTSRLWLRDYLMPPPSGRSLGALLCPTTPLEKKLPLRSIVCAARHGLLHVMLLSKVWGKRRVSACASLHHCHWYWHRGRIRTVVFIAHGGEWHSFWPNELTCGTRLKVA